MEQSIYFRVEGMEGRWVDIEEFDSADEIYGELRSRFNTDDWAIVDSQGVPKEFLDTLDFNPRLIDEFDAWLEQDEFVREVYYIWTTINGVWGSISEVMDSFCGYHDKFVDFAEELMDEISNIPDNLAGYIDYDSFAEDLRHDYDYDEDSGAVFRRF